MLSLTFSEPNCALCVFIILYKIKCLNVDKQLATNKIHGTDSTKNIPIPTTNGCSFSH